MHRIHRTAAVLALAVLGACYHRDATSPDDAPAATTRTEAARTPGEVREGYVRGPGGKPMRVTYEVHGGRAIWQGDIDLGPASSIPRTAAGVRPDGPRMGVTIDGVFGGVRWPGGVVPYVIDAGVPSQSRITDAITAIEAVTNVVDFVPRSSQADYVRFSTIADGCSSPVGRQGGAQTVGLASGCTKGNVEHELLHALGLDHEQNRCDRDSYVTIVTANIDPNRLGNFTKQCTGFTDIGAYDEGSIMHAGPYDHSANGQATIVSLRGLASLMGQRTALSATDVATVDTLYPTPPAAAVVTSVSTSPSPAVQYNPFTLTINGSGFDPSTVQVQITGTSTSSCPTACTSFSFTSKTSTQIVIYPTTYSIPGTYQVWVRNPVNANWSGGQTITVRSLYP